METENSQPTTTIKRGWHSQQDLHGNQKIRRLARRRHLERPEQDGTTSRSACVSDFKKSNSHGDLLTREVLGDLTNQRLKRKRDDEPAKKQQLDEGLATSSLSRSGEQELPTKRVRRLSSSKSLQDVLLLAARSMTPTKKKEPEEDKENILLAEFEDVASSPSSCTPPPLKRNRSRQSLLCTSSDNIDIPLLAGSEKKDKGKEKVKDDDETQALGWATDRQPVSSSTMDNHEEEEGDYWECTECTFHNNLTFLVCNVCFGVRQENARVKLSNKRDDDFGDRWVLVRRHCWMMKGQEDLTVKRNKKPSSNEEEGEKEKSNEEETLLEIHPAQEPPEDGYCWFDSLPVEIMFKILGHLKANTLWRLCSVSRYWREVCSDSCLWGPLQVAIKRESKLVPNPPPSYARSWSWRSQQQNWGSSTTLRYVVVDMNGTEVGELDWESTEAKREDTDWFDLYKQNTTAHVIQTTDIPKTSEDPYWQWRCGLNEDDQVEGRLLFNIGRLESEILRGKRTSLPCLNLLFRLADQAFSSITFENYKKQCVPSWFAHAMRKGAVHAVRQPKHLTVNLFSYQLESLNWMLEMERRANERSGWQFSQLPEWRSLTKSLWVDQKLKTLRSFEEAPADHTATLYTKGGILSDEMGLGKTLTVLGLILSNPQTSESLAKLPPLDDAHFETKASLVFCPNHLAKQWLDEIEGKTNPKLKVLMLTTVMELKAVNYYDIMNADVVVASFQLFKNQNYLRKCYKAKKFVHADRLRNILNASRRMKIQIAEGTAAKDPLLLKFPFLEQFRWHRVIVDEGHEILADRYFLKSLKGIEAQYRWYVTGTPLPHGIDSLRGAARFMQAEISSGQKIFGRTITGRGKYEVTRPDNKFFDWKLAEVMMRNIYCRHTKLSVGKEYAVPGLKEKVMLLQMSETERAMYLIAKTHGDKLHMRQLCCHPQINNDDCSVLGAERQSMEGIKNKMIAHKHDQIRLHKKKIQEKREAIQLLKGKLKELEAKIENEKEKRKAEQRRNPTLTWAYITEVDEAVAKRKKNIKATISRHQTEIERIKAGPIRTLRTEMEFFKSIKSPQIQEKEKENKDTQQKMKDEGEEEEEEEMMKDKEDKMVDTGEEEEEEEEKGGKEKDQSMRSLINMYGSKMAHLIHYIREVCVHPETRIIIFSQWDKMLQRVGETLSENGIANVCCKGNVIRRRKAISAFKNATTGTRVLMLSLQNSASGTNLTEATHIIMLDPVAGSREAARATEGQALGRAHRLGQTRELTVVRLIMENTIEHKLYLRNYASLVDASLSTGAHK